MTKRALIILAEGFEDIEAVVPIDLLRRAGIEVTVAGLTALIVKGARGIVINAEKKLDQISGEYNILILPGGGNGARNLAASQEVKNLILEMNKKGKWISAICASPATVLAPTGVLNHKSATGFPGSENQFDKSTKVLKEKVVIDGNIITSVAAGTSIDFALTIIEKLCSKEESEKVRKAIVY